MSLLRLDSATALKRFFQLERALTTAAAAWVPIVERLETKAELARTAWETALTAEALRRRVFELRFPERDLAVVEDAELIASFEGLIHAPSARAFVMTLADVTCPALRSAYAAYLDSSDEVADGPTFRFLRTAIDDKLRQAVALRVVAGREEGDDGPLPAPALVGSWSRDPLGPAPAGEAPGPAPFEIPDDPGRDPAYFPCNFYWPDNFDPAYPYGEGLRLQVRSAVSHVNEVWATDAAGAILYGYGDVLGWEFVIDAARWLYDESRHMMMGQRRLRAWGIPDEEVPLGAFIYQAGAGRGPLHRLGMLAYFETKNIGKKVERAEAFGRLGDDESRRDMEFDWADEAIHAGYGRTWLRKAMEAEGRDPEEWRVVVEECEDLIRQRVARATEDEKQAIYLQAERVMELATKGAA